MSVESSFSHKHILAVDIGGTKLAVALVAQDGRILARNQEATLQSGPQDGIAQIIRLLEGVLTGAGFSAQDAATIGIGIPAVLEPKTDFVIWGPNLNGWRNVALRPALEAHFALPTCVEYDGHAAVLGEWWMGAGRGYHSVVDLIIGTGLGGGIILEDHLVRGHNRLAGAAGWFVLNPELGQRSEQERSLGFWEARTAGPGIARRAAEVLASGLYPGSLLEGCPAELTARDVFRAAQQGDPLAGAVVDEVSVLLSAGIANIVSLVNPEVIILGGSVGAHAGFLIPRITEMVNRWAQPISAQSTRIVPSQLAGEAGLLGAAYGALLRLKENSNF